MLSAVPLEDKTVAEGKTTGGIGSRLVTVEHATSESGLDMADHLVLESILVGKAVG